MEDIYQALEKLTVDERQSAAALPNTGLEYSDIQAMTLTTMRNKNDHYNKKRELILTKLLTLDATYFEDETYGAQWTTLKEKWSELLTRICDVPYTDVTVQPKAGRGHHYDFHITYMLANSTQSQTIEKKVEFKHNCSSIARLPQFLSLSEKHSLFIHTSSYAEEYYEKYIERYIACDPEITVSKPSKEDYLRMVYTTNYDIHPFFRCLYDRSKFYTKEKNAVVNESIKEFLTKYIDQLDLEKLTDKFQTTQKDKVFVMWDLKKFHVDQFNTKDLTLTSNDGLHRGNVIRVKSATSMFHLLLRWRNHKGILLPAWQISLKNRHYRFQLGL